MTTASLKKKIRALLEKETSEHRLLNALASLSDDVPGRVVQEQVNERIARAEADFRAGRSMSGDEAHEKIKAALKHRKNDRAA